jgi:hypothetical protein
LPLGLLGMLGVGVEVACLETGRRADVEEMANRRVCRKVKVAQTLLAAKRWDEATAVLQDALATADATDLSSADHLLAQVGPARIANLAGEAKDAMQKQDPVRARNLLLAYLDEADAPEKDGAFFLLCDLDRAASPTMADEVLRQVSDQELNAFARGGEVPAFHRFTDPALQAIFARTLMTRMVAECQRREDLRKDQERRQARIRATPAYQELLRFSDAIRQSRTRTETNPRLVAYLFQDLNITDAAEQAKTMAELTGPPAEAASLQQSIARERIALKERLRSYEGFDQADRESFEQMVDQQLDLLTKEVGWPIQTR